ncbi:MAG: hypothetical protein RMJ33_08410 [Saprospiraceae bacterium]|nr:hypothetical protein [Saprospiraceae bacterium]MDW8229846.1 hypothetical protein [Saprospiraceae bacterium]
MRPTFLTSLVFLAGMVIAASSITFAQSPLEEDLRMHEDFFRARMRDYQQWLTYAELDRVLYADSIAVSQQRVTLFLRAAHQGERVCDSLQCAWERLEQENFRRYGQYFRERLLRKWAFLAEIHEEQAEVVVRCHEPAHFLMRIRSDRGRILRDWRSVRGSVFQVHLPTFTAFQNINLGEGKAIIPGQQAPAVSAKARRFLINHYKPKGTPILWRARIDTSFVTFDEFVLEVTHLSHEICPDGYYEYHRITVWCAQRGPDTELTWEFQGKYGSGILFPPRKNDYKDLSLRYKDNLEEYQQRLFKRLVYHLIRQ